MAEGCLTHAENKLSSLSLADQDAVSCHHCSDDEYDSNCKNCCSKLDGRNEEEKLDHVKETCNSESEDDSGGNFEDTDEQIHKATEGATAPSTDDEYHSADEGDIQVDEELLKNMEETLSDEEKKERQECAQQFKEKGNQEFKAGNFQEAMKLYSKALQMCPLAFPKDRAIMYSNRAAAFMRMQKNKKAIEDSCSALELNPDYLKALLRRAELYEKEDKLEDALQDYKKIVEMDPSQHSARAACLRLPEQIEERNEKLKAEMMGKLKDLGNMILKPFGLSTDNFQMQKDPQSGSYSVNFKQNVDAT
ncbi:tetratricopeptide repeat protein 1 [Octopus bimaculoides]|uniref:Tetratricopeptide repeat protein 1 n=1 Tax=Octopus bimaculoides TaxID=37653 RepID=A0A0L8FS53_OCTBM|nr:tetratricopeptide repeat protein 1 [Octopus bimaculoides]|eukprot:XP_014787435.1 PREDICTED: tetratricopeptide repeat protein 1-like [Octopus bimaculoides]